MQDQYLGTLQSYNDKTLQKIKDPQNKIVDDGTQSFTFQVPKYYIDQETNQRTLNPHWEDINNGVLAENTRILKVFRLWKRNKSFSFSNR